MSILATVNNGINAAIVAAGDAINDVLVAGSIELAQQPGEDYAPSWLVYSGKGFWEMAEAADYPGTEVLVNDETLVLMKCDYDVKAHDFVNVAGSSYHVHAVKFDRVGSTRVLQKLLARLENRKGIPWESADLQAA